MNKKFEYIPVRLSHLLRHCSVGAIVRGPDYLVTVKDTSEWTDKNGHLAGKPILYVDGVRSALRIEEQLREPPISKLNDGGKVDGVCIPVQRFPTWMRCPHCGLLHSKPWLKLTDDEVPRCNQEDIKKCKGRPKLEQAPWALIHELGHLADVPWHFITHSDAKTDNERQCRQDWNDPYLQLIDSGVSSLKLVCQRCRITKKFTLNDRIPFGKTRQQPWLTKEADMSDELATIVEINDVRVHMPETSNALVIPPESRLRIGSVVDRLYSSTSKQKQIEDSRTPFARRNTIRVIASELLCSTEDVEKALTDIKNGYPLFGQNITQGILLENEYLALLEEMADVMDDEDFVTQHYTSDWKKLILNLDKGSRPEKIISAVSHLIAVNRLKEIMVLKGFRRLGGKLVLPHIIGESTWLPALELYGEGVFFTLDKQMLNHWEAHFSIQKRADDFRRRFEATGLKFQNEVVVSPRFILLHTIAHLLIRQLETKAGYPAASLKERIYCTAGKLPMSGILIYVAVPDVVGSLGGLAELATPDRFLNLLSSVFDHAQWCSLDPVCSEHNGQGPSMLNKAACHGCALVPEPCCAYGNILLDRIFIKGDLANDIPAFLDCIELDNHAT